LVAWRYLAHLPDDEHIDHLLYDLERPAQSSPSSSHGDPEQSIGDRRRSGTGLGLGNTGIHPISSVVSELTGLLSSPFGAGPSAGGPDRGEHEDDPLAQFVGLNALEIATVAEAKNFLSQRVVQQILDAIWVGDIIFWDSMGVQTTKKAQRYNKRYDPLGSVKLENV
jgi:hypothetical protein